MIDPRKSVFAVDVWLWDLALTALSFLLAYQARLFFSIEGHTVMPFQVYTPSLIIVIASIAIVLPLFRVYSQRAQTLTNQAWELAKAVSVAGCVAVALPILLREEASSRLLVLFTIAIDYAFLVSSRVLL